MNPNKIYINPNQKYRMRFARTVKTEEYSEEYIRADLVREIMEAAKTEANKHVNVDSEEAFNMAAGSQQAYLHIYTELYELINNQTS